MGAIWIILVAEIALYATDQKLFIRQIVFFKDCLVSLNLYGEMRCSPTHS